MSDVVHPPWRLAGEAVLAWVHVPKALRRGLPGGLRPMPGPGAVVGVRYTDSPVGPYNEIAVLVPARIGLRPGFCAVAQAVSAADARVGYRLNWGIPAELGAVSWHTNGDVHEVRWDERGLVVRAAAVGPTLPVLLPLRSVQRRVDGPVVIPRRLYALARLARSEVDVPDGDDLVPLAGVHRGVLLAGMRVVAHPARHPTGLLSSLRAPSSAAEPALVQPGFDRAGRAAA